MLEVMHLIISISWVSVPKGLYAFHLESWVER